MIYVITTFYMVYVVYIQDAKPIKTKEKEREREREREKKRRNN